MSEKEAKQKVESWLNTAYEDNIRLQIEHYSEVKRLTRQFLMRRDSNRKYWHGIKAILQNFAKDRAKAIADYHGETFYTLAHEAFTKKC